jgi:ABC-type oligopeptide transport system substrate-binding subunit
MSKRITIWVGVLVTGLALLVAAGCGGGDDEGAGTTAATTETGETLQGGTLRVNLNSDTDYIDPALAYYQTSWQFEYVTAAKLLNYPDAPAPEGSRLEPEVADGMPEVSEDGKTYTFTIKPGFAFSPPSTEEITAETFKKTFERVLDPKMQSPGASFVEDIVGAKDVLDGKATEVSGITVDGDTLVIELERVAPDFLARIAMPFFSAVPVDTPHTAQSKPIASAGPYYVKSWSPTRQLVVAKNPNYDGDRPAVLDEIQYTVGVNLAAGLLQVEKGEADYAGDGVPAAEYARLGREFGPDSDAAEEGRQQFFYNPGLVINYYALNTSRELFGDPKLRQAVNFAIDRRSILRQLGAYGGEPTDQYLPFAIEGFVDVDVYPFTPDVDRAKELMGGKTGTAVLYTCTTPGCQKRSQILQANLKAIGIDVEIKQFQRSIQFQREGVRTEPFDIADEGWIADYPDPYDFINVLLDGNRIQETNNVNFSYFDDPLYNEKMQEAAALTGDERWEAYAKLDEELTRDAAPWAAWAVGTNRDFFSSKVGCVQYQPIYGMNFAVMCLRAS